MHGCLHSEIQVSSSSINRCHFQNYSLILIMFTWPERRQPSLSASWSATSTAWCTVAPRDLSLLRSVHGSVYRLQFSLEINSHLLTSTPVWSGAVVASSARTARAFTAASVVAVTGGRRSGSGHGGLRRQRAGGYEDVRTGEHCGAVAGHVRVSVD